METIVRTSIFISVLKKIYTRECLITNWIYTIFTDSQIYKLIVRFKEGIRINFRYSFLGKITEINREQNFAILETSNVMERLRKLSNKILAYFQVSVIRSFMGKLNRKLYLFPIKTGSTIIIIVIITNITLSSLLKREIGLWGWFLRGMFIFIAGNGLSSQVSWEEVRKTSYFLRHLNNPCKI